MEMVHFIPPGQRRLALLAAQADSAPALICGGSGTGKGAIARWIHNNGPRAAKSFFTAKRTQALALQIAEAQEGTLVIPEIGEWPLGEQKVLLEFLHTRTIRYQEIRKILNVRIIATSSQNLEGRAQGGLFNIELLEKLNVFRIEMPPFSKRQEEFEDIALGIVSEITRELNKDYLRTLSPDAWKRLRSYDWPGNLRELRNVLRLAVLQAKGDRIEESDLPEFGVDRIDFRATREEFEKTYLTRMLTTYDWNIDQACDQERIDRKTLLDKIEKYGIRPDISHPGA